jgi:serine/threonine protein kinase
MQHLQPNTTLQGGKYRIERVLGQGGFGITYLATQLSLQRQVAVKEFFMKDFCSRDESIRTMSAPSTGSSKLVEQYRKKFIKEARNLARLNHPHIISVIDVFEENGTVYYVMPYLIGGSLQDYVKTHGTLSEQEAMKYVKQIASALKYMHDEHHICHYDVKPANILLDDKGNAVLIDFGISKNYDSVGQETTTTPVGKSEGYAPIEQYQQNVEEFSPASDVYALGATLYFLLHGKRPVSAVHRASGTALLMSKQLSQGIKDIINASMKISKRERAKSMNVFLKESYFSGHEKNSFDTSVTDDEETIIVPQKKSKSKDDEETIIDNKNAPKKKEPHASSDNNQVYNTDSDEGYSSGFKYFLITVALIASCVAFFYFGKGETTVEPEVDTDSIPEVDGGYDMSMEADTIVDYSYSKLSNSNSDKKNYDVACEKVLTESDIQGYSSYDLKIMRNWIFARHGYIFKTTDMRDFFENQSWYYGEYDDVSDMLTDIERYNIDFIKRHE